MPNLILGISAFYHDSAAVLLENGAIVAAAQEERFTRKKHDADFPKQAAEYVLNEGSCRTADLDAIAFYDKPFLKFERLLETYHAFAPKGLSSFLSSIPVWTKEKIFMRKLILDGLGWRKGQKKPRLLFPEHHLSHAASAFFPSPFESAAILTIDGVGEWATTTIGQGRGNQIKILRELKFPHSLGLLYSAVTYYCGFKVNSGEYKLMGLAPYGILHSDRVKKFKKLFYDEIIDLRDDGSLLLNMDYFTFATGLRMCNEKKWASLFGMPKRAPESEVGQEYMDMALAIQQVTEDAVLRMAQTAKALTNSPYLVMAGGVALNCVANGKLLNSRLFEDIWIQPAAGDAGGALGAAYAAWYIYNGKDRILGIEKDSMQGAYLGPQFSDLEIRRTSRKFNADYKEYADLQNLCEQVAEYLSEGKIIGWYQGRMEYGPRALGNRSIVGDPRNPDMQKRLNLKIKYREGFRPFAPSVLSECMDEYFELHQPSPYMLLVEPVKKSRWNALPDGYDELPLFDRLYHIRSDIPAITHVDFSARIQTVHSDTNPRYFQLISAFKTKTGYGLLVNTSFNVRGEPIVCTPEDAYRCFMNTEMDYLVLGNMVFDKQHQPPLRN